MCIRESHYEQRYKGVDSVGMERSKEEWSGKNKEKENKMVKVKIDSE